jgi:hypothetical protein
MLLLNCFPPFKGTRRFITVFTRALHCSLSLTTPSYISEIRLNTIQVDHVFNQLSIKPWRSMESRYINPRFLFLHTRLRWVWSFTPLSYYPQRNSPDTHWLGDWVGPQKRVTIPYVTQWRTKELSFMSVSVAMLTCFGHVKCSVLYNVA